MIRIHNAIIEAQLAHREQKYWQFPYMFHLMQVMALWISFWLSEDELIACILHDTIEDTEMTASLIEKSFGYNVSEIVELCTHASKKDWYEALSKNPSAVRVKMCDRISNINMWLSEWNKRTNAKYQNEAITTFIKVVEACDDDRIVDAYNEVLFTDIE